MTNSRCNSLDSGDIPIPTAPQGGLRRVDTIFNRLRGYYHILTTQVRIRTLAYTTAVSLLLIPSLLSSPDYALAIEQNPVLSETQTLPEDWSPALKQVLKNEVTRHGIDNNSWVTIVDQYIAMVKHIESDNKRMAYNPSGAMSYFQFKPASVQTAHNRLVNYIKRHELGAIPRWSVSLYYNPQNIYHEDANKQALLMLINIIEQDRERGTDYFKQLLEGDTRAGVEAYYRYHHTNPDHFTKKRTERLYNTYFNEALLIASSA